MLWCWQVYLAEEIIDALGTDTGICHAMPSTTLRSCVAPWFLVSIFMWAWVCANLPRPTLTQTSRKYTKLWLFTWNVPWSVTWNVLWMVTCLLSLCASTWMPRNKPGPSDGVTTTFGNCPSTTCNMMIPHGTPPCSACTQVYICYKNPKRKTQDARNQNSLLLLLEIDVEIILIC